MKLNLTISTFDVKEINHKLNTIEELNIPLIFKVVEKKYQEYERERDDLHLVLELIKGVE